MATDPLSPRASRRHLMAGGIGAVAVSALPGRWLAPVNPGLVAAGEDCVTTYDSPDVGVLPEGTTLFPADDVWNTPVDDLPVADRSDAWIASIGLDTGLHPDFASGLYEGSPIGIPFMRVPEDQPLVDVTFDVPEESDEGPYPIPVGVPVEGGSCGEGDRHVIVVQEGTNLLFELYDAHPQDDGSWHAFVGTRFDLGSSELRPDTWTSADAAGLPILPGLVRYEEIEAGVIPHALRFPASLTRDDYVWPARHHAGATDDPDVPAMGQRFRLRADVGIDGFSETNQVILRALQTYGMFLADNGSDWFLSGVPDDRWDNDDLHLLQDGIRGEDFEAVDCSSLMVDPDSGTVT